LLFNVNAIDMGIVFCAKGEVETAGRVGHAGMPGLTTLNRAFMNFPVSKLPARKHRAVVLITLPTACPLLAVDAVFAGV
jgi:hypothetical protein